MPVQLQRGSTRSKPEGGYCSIPVVTIALLWWCYTQGLLTLRAVRVGLALFELRLRRAAYVWTEKRRGNKIPDFVPRYTTKELGDHCGLPEKRAKAALTELLTLGLLTEFTETKFFFAPKLHTLALTSEQAAEFRTWLSTLTKRRQVPIPRRILALACESSAPALIAVILGVCLRCSWLRPGEGFSFTGRIACSWLARRFGISLRAIQQAKEHLVGLGWLERTGKINRFGETVAINPDWHRLIALPELQDETPKNSGAGEENFSTEPTPAPPAEGPAGTKSAGVQAPPGTKSAGVSLTEESLPEEEFKYQRKSQADELPEQFGPGVFLPQPRGKENTATATPVSAGPLPPPRLSAIRPEDFQDVGRALELFRQAVQCGLMSDSEHSRLIWMAAIERARTVPAENPAGLFLYLIKHEKWDFLSNGHFDAANARLKAYLYGSPRSEEVSTFGSVRPSSERPSLSKDALLVQAVKNELAQRGVRCELYPVLRSQVGWDRSRFEAAVAELEGVPPQLVASLGGFGERGRAGALAGL